MGYIRIYDVKDRDLLKWNEGTREWDGYTGYTTSPLITLSIGSSTSITMTIEIKTDDVLTFENGETTKVIPLASMKDVKTFKLEWKVRLLKDSIIEGPPKNDQMEIALPGGNVKKYDVLKYRLTPRIGFKITVMDSDRNSKFKKFYLTKMVEVLNEANS